MDNHPIPQDVTGFQFKLIGNMTIKQFAYVAVGVVSSVIIFYMKFLGILRFLILVVPSSVGVGLAFLPIEGRPMDVMMGNFLRALFAPNQYLFQKMGGHLAFAAIGQKSTQVPVSPQNIPTHTKQETEKQQKLQAYLQTMQTAPKNDLDVKESQALQSLSSIIGPAPQTATPASPTPQLQNAPAVAPVPAPQQREEPRREAPQPLTSPVQKPQAVDSEIANILSQKEELKDELSQMKQDLFTVHAQSTTPVVPPQPMQVATIPVVPQPQITSAATTQITQPENTQQTITTQTVTQTTTSSQTAPKTPFVAMSKPLAGASRPAGIYQPTLSAPAAPNIIIGNVRDSRANALANILVEIKDKEGNPIRAFKTNVLGQFASATPLQNGSYTIILEDPKAQHAFQPIQIEAAGALIPTLEIVSVDARETLRRELFN